MSWQTHIAHNVKTVEELAEVLQLSNDEVATISEEAEHFPFSIPHYYLSLIDKNDPDDPIRKMCVPTTSISDDGELDTSGEHSNTVMQGVQHKYRQSVLVLTSQNCVMYCRHCFRRRMVGVTEEEIATDPAAVAEYVKAHPEVNNCLLTGGDSFALSTPKIKAWLEALRDLPQLDFIRLGTRIPVVFPERITSDPELLDVLHGCRGVKQLYVITHYNHPREITPESAAAIHALQECDVVVKNQAVLLKGINDDPETLSALLRGLTSMGVVPHYIFQCRPVKGVKSHFQVPIVEGSRIVNEARAMQNGLGKSCDYTMSHKTGKIRIIGLNDDGAMVFQYVQAKDPARIGKVFTRVLPDDVTWFDDDPLT